MKIYFKIYFCFILLLISFRVSAGLKWVQIGVNGLTCSACSRSVEMSIRKLDFVQDVEMNLEHTEGKITFKPNAFVNFEKIAQAVFDAGFSVRYLQASFSFETSVSISDNFCCSVSGYVFRFFTDKPQSVSGDVILKFIGKKYLPQKEYKQWKAKHNNPVKCEAQKTYDVTL
ncbi:MAG TPA: heavy metal-associated domain-containing protein [Bacteroidia bacterium]|jgi:cation transport ATPase|nr:heavy metal-associated domain-containing protein [Bacteroidia bacterium]